MSPMKLEELSTSKMPEEDLLMRSTTAKTIAAAWSDIHLCQCTRFWETSDAGLSSHGRGGLLCGSEGHHLSSHGERHRPRARQVSVSDFNKIFLQTDVLVQDALLPLYLDSVRNFSLKKAKCHKESDRKLLEQKIHREYVSEEAFEKLMQATVIAFMARSMAYPAGRNPELERRLYTPWVSLAWELHMDDLALALASFHSREFRRMACSGSWLEQSAPDILALPDAKHLEELAAQIDLHTVNSVEYHNVVLDPWPRSDESMGLPRSKTRGRMRPLGVRMKNRLDAGRNYAAPDDELLM
eukprot:g19871.t1